MIVKKSVSLLSVAVTIATTVAIAAPEVDPDKKIVTSKMYVDAGLAGKQAVLPANGRDVAVTYPEIPGGTPGQRNISNTVGDNTSDPNLVTSGGVASALRTKQDTVNGVSGSAGKVVLYNSVGGLSGTNNPARGIYNANVNYNTQQNSLVEAQHVNAAVQNGFNAHVTCDTSNLAPDGDCWLYRVNTLDGTYVPSTRQ